MVHTSADITEEPTTRDRGFVMITFALLLIPIVIFTAFAVDISSWYSRATELQRSADAAALAGVVWMPDLSTAEGVANPTLERNGMVDGTDNISVSMSVGATSSSSFRVCVTDTKVTQFFASVFAGNTSITRCATAEYNSPLQLGSPLNYFGGNDSLQKAVPKPPPADALGATPDPAVFASDSRCWVKNGSGQTVGFWDSNGYPNSYSWKYWPWPANNLSGSHPDCGVSAPALPDRPGDRDCYVPGSPHAYWYQEDTGYAYPSGWRYRVNPSASVDDECTYGSEIITPIPASKSPNFWAAIEGYYNDHGNGDAYATKGSEHKTDGYWYAIDIPAGGVNGGVVSIQAWDGAYNRYGGSRTPMGDDSNNGTTPTRFRVFKAGAMKYDMSSITPATCSTGSSDSGYVTSDPAWNLRWKELCVTSASAGERFYVQVQSSDESSSSQTGGGYNGYAMRAVAGTFPAACLDTMPAGDVACYGTGVQPSLTAFGSMEMYNGIPEGQPTEFYLANVTPKYAGKTLEISLFDPGDGAPQSWVTVMAPSSTDTLGTPVPSSACTVNFREYGGTTWNSVPLSNGPSGAYSGTCTVQTSNNGKNAYQDRWLRFRIPLPSTYGPTGTDPWKCDDSVTDPVNNPGSCWWQIKYFTKGGSLSDYTTWTARIIGDPVRLTM